MKLTRKKIFGLLRFRGRSKEPTEVTIKEPVEAVIKREPVKVSIILGDKVFGEYTTYR